MILHLKIYRDQHYFKDFVISHESTKVGRSPECQILLPDDSVSWVHAVFEQNEKGIWVLKDLGSLNGIRLGHQPVTEITIDKDTRFHVGIFEFEVMVIPTGSTRLLGAQDWILLNRRRGSKHYVLYFVSSVLYTVGAILLYPTMWMKQNQQFYGMVLLLLVIVPALALLLLVVYRALSRKVRLADTLEWLRDYTALFFGAKLIETMIFYFIPLEYFSLLSETFIYAFFLFATLSLLTYRSGISKRWKTQLLLLVSAIIMGRLFIVGFEMVKNKSSRQVYTQVLPPLFKSANAEAPEKLVQRLDELMADLNKKNSENKSNDHPSSRPNR